MLKVESCLNPYCSGRWSRTIEGTIAGLVYINVLILIVVEDGLVPLKVNLRVQNVRSLNPYCSGRWSRTMKSVVRKNLVMS